MRNCDEILFNPNRSWYRILYTYKFFTGDKMWRTHAGERAPFWLTALIFACAGGLCFVSPVMFHYITQYTQYFQNNIPNDWVVHNSPSLYIDFYGWIKYMARFAPMCLFSPLNPPVLLCDTHDSHFDVRALIILWSHCI